MNTRAILVEDNKGNKVPAILATCPQCEGDAFHIMVINNHNHLQCTSCGTSFCQGECDKGGDVCQQHFETGLATN